MLHLASAHAKERAISGSDTSRSCSYLDLASLKFNILRTSYTGSSRNTPGLGRRVMGGGETCVSKLRTFDSIMFLFHDTEGREHRGCSLKPSFWLGVLSSMICPVKIFLFCFIKLGGLS